MKTNSAQYTALASWYDVFVGVDYTAIADFIDKTVKHLMPEAELVLDLACGTGNLTLKLAGMGYDMTGIDISSEMLSCAIAKRARGKRILWLNQDIRSFELYGTVDVAVCVLDSINYLCSIEDVRECFAHVRNYLNPNGLFIFDCNTRYKFENLLDGRVYNYEKDGVFCSWESSFAGKSGICRHTLNFFNRRIDGNYSRSTEQQTQKYYSRRTIKQLLSENSLDIIDIYPNYSFEQLSERDERICFVTRKK